MSYFDVYYFISNQRLNKRTQKSNEPILQLSILSHALALRNAYRNVKMYELIGQNDKHRQIVYHFH